MTTATDSPEAPWYKQFWPWFVFSLPAITVVAGITTVIIAVKGADSLVVDDYYKEGLAINQIKDKQRLARELQVSAALRLQDKFITIKLDSGKAAKNDTYFIEFRHATLAERDFKAALSATATAGTYRILIPENFQGKWQVAMYPQQESWVLKGQWTATTQSLELR